MNNIPSYFYMMLRNLSLNKKFIATVLFYIIASTYCIGCISNLVVAVEEVIYTGYDTLYASDALSTPRDITSLKTVNLENISSSEDYVLDNKSGISTIEDIYSTYQIDINKDVYTNTRDTEETVLSEKFLNLTYSDRLNQNVLEEFINKLPASLTKVLKNNYIEITIDNYAVDLNKIFYSKSNTLPDIIEINKGLHGFTFTEIDYVNKPSVTALIISSSNPGHIELIVESGIPVVIKTNSTEWLPYLPTVGLSIPKYTVTNNTVEVARQYLQRDDDRSKKYGLQCLTEMLLLSLYCEEYQGSSLIGVYDVNFDYKKFYSVLKSLDTSKDSSELGSIDSEHISKIFISLGQSYTTINGSVNNVDDITNINSDTNFEDENNKDSLYYEQPNNTTQNIYIKDEEAMKDVLEIDKTLNDITGNVTNSSTDTATDNDNKNGFNANDFLNPVINTPSSNPINSSTTSNNITPSGTATSNITTNKNPSVSFWIDDNTTQINYSKSKEDLEKERLEGLKKALSVNKTPMIWGVAYNGDNFAVVDKDGSSLLYNAFTKFKYNFTTLTNEDDYMHQLVITKATPLKTLPRIIPSDTVKSITPNYLIPFASYTLSILIFIGFIIFVNVYAHNEKRRKRLEITKRERATYESTLFNNFDSYDL